MVLLPGLFGFIGIVVLSGSALFVVVARGTAILTYWQRVIDEVAITYHIAFTTPEYSALVERHRPFSLYLQSKVTIVLVACLIFIHVHMLDHHCMVLE